MLNLLHIVLHLALKVIFEEIKQVVLYVHLLNLIVDGFQLTVHFAVLCQFAKASQFSSHLDQLELFLIGSILFALLLDF